MRFFLVIILSFLILYGCEKNDTQVLNHDTIVKNPFPETEYEKGIRNLNQENVDLAIINFQKQIELDATNFRPYVALASIYIKAKDYLQAKTLLEKAVLLKTQQPDIYYLLTQCYSELGEKQKAIDAIRTAIGLYSQNKNETKYLNALKILKILNKNK